MKSRTFSPATFGEQDEEEVAELVPPAPEEKGDHTAVPSPGPPRPSVLLRTSAMAGLVFLALLLGFGRWIMPETSFRLDNVSSSTGQRRPLHHSLLNSTAPFTCSNGTSTTCPATAVLPLPRQWPPAAPSCPDYFRYIHDDLRPWRDGGITRDAMERARKYAYFRLVVVGGRAYVDTYQRSFQTRDVFSQWGILQLMRRYPGRVPDLDIMFACDDLGQVRVADFPTPSDAPPVFRYCKDDSKLDILFPDWSFWGWPEVGIRPWTPMLVEVERENDRVRWSQREPQAFWKGNPNKYYLRDQMMNCNVSNAKEWNARLFNQETGAKPHETVSKIPTFLSNAYTGYVKARLQQVAFSGKIVYCRTRSEVEKATAEIVRKIERMKDSGPVSLGFDLEWQPFPRRGEPPSKVALMQLCMDKTHCYLMHIIHSGVPPTLKSLLEDSSSVKVGVCIDNDARKMFNDYDVRVQPLSDLSAVANVKLAGPQRRWSLAALTEMITSKELPKPSNIRMGNWESYALSKQQLQYAATDAYISWYLYEVLQSLPDYDVDAEKEVV